MAQLKLSIYTICTLAICCTGIVIVPASAQVDPIFREELPRPPRDVPGASQQRSYPSQIAPRQSPADINNERGEPEGADGDDDDNDQQNNDLPDERIFQFPPQPQVSPQVSPQVLPQASPPSRPRPRSIESQDLAPPPERAPATEEKANKSPSVEPGQPAQNVLPPISAPAPILSGKPQEVSPSTQTDTVVVAPPPQRIPNPTAVFAGLDKITGRIISFDVAINETVQFGALQVTPRICYSRPPTERANTDSFIEVDEVTLKGEIKRIFTGWMFAASPGLHAVEHPIYDVWLTDCKGAQSPAVAERVSDQNDKRKPAGHVAPKPAQRQQLGAPQRR